MKSEDKKLKETENLEINDDKTTIDEEIKHKFTPLINVKKVPGLSDSIINYLAMGICYVVYGCYHLGWLDVDKDANKDFYLGYFLVASICLYITGIFNWYEGKELIFLIDFIMSFLFMTLYLKNQTLENLAGKVSENDTDKLQGIFYILLFCFILVIGISSKDKGIVYIFDYAVLFITYVFLFAYKFFKNEWIKKIDFYIFVICGGLFWITGIIKILNSVISGSIGIVEPSD